jgi:plasmid stabilization system protein ParE
VTYYHIIIEPEAGSDLESIYNYIEKENTSAKAQRFLRKLQTAISTLNFMPKRFRKSIYMNDEKTHDMVVHGYTVCYHIVEETVHIVAIFRQRAL